MSSVNYSLKNKGVRLIPSESAWVKGKNGKMKLNRDYDFIGKVEMSMPNVIVSSVIGKRASYKGDVVDLNRTAKKQIVEHFYDDNGKRNKRTVAYFGVKKV